MIHRRVTTFQLLLRAFAKLENALNVSLQITMTLLCFDQMKKTSIIFLNKNIAVISTILLNQIIF